MKNFTCPTCQKKFTRLHDMKRHHISIHMVEVDCVSETKCVNKKMTQKIISMSHVSEKVYETS